MSKSLLGLDAVWTMNKVKNFNVLILRDADPLAAI